MVDEQPKPFRRKQIRLKDYDYSQNGYYFVTVCTQNKMCLFGRVVKGQIRLNEAGKMVETEWQRIPDFFPGIGIDEFVIMPNHIHGIVVISNRPYNVGAPLVGAQMAHANRAGTRPAPTLGRIVGAFKSITTKSYIDGVKNKKWPSFIRKIWQRNYHDRVIRDEKSLNETRQYIINNPAQWELDEENPKNWR